MDIALGAEVNFSEGWTGKVTRVIINPITREMTHIVVKAKGAFEQGKGFEMMLVPEK